MILDKIKPFILPGLAFSLVTSWAVYDCSTNLDAWRACKTTCGKHLEIKMIDGECYCAQPEGWVKPEVVGLLSHARTHMECQ